jgi:hypothetical protein
MRHQADQVRAIRPRPPCGVRIIRLGDAPCPPRSVEGASTRARLKPAIERPVHWSSVERQAGQEPRRRPASAVQVIRPRPGVKPVRSFAHGRRSSGLDRQPHASFVSIRPACTPSPRRSNTNVHDEPRRHGSRLAPARRCRYTYPWRRPYFLTLQANCSPIANIRNVLTQVLID